MRKSAVSFVKHGILSAGKTRISSPGDFLTVDLLGEPIIVVRDRAGKVRAFANTCRHRGTRLVSGSGRCPAIRCPYHSWTYSLTGELIGAPGMEGVVSFNKADYGLIPIRNESWGDSCS